MMDRKVFLILQYILDECVVDLCCEVHRNLKTKKLSLDEIYDMSVPQPYENDSNKEEKCDVHGQKPPQDPPGSFECAHCGRPVHPLRYAPHLDKCMGVGQRSSQRVSSSDVQQSTSTTQVESTGDLRGKAYSANRRRVT